MPSNAPKKRAAPSAAAFLLLLLTPLRSSAMALPSFRQEHQKMPPTNEDKYNGDGRRSFFKLNFKGKKKAEGQKLTPIGPLPRGGSLSDVAITSNAAASAAMEQPRQPLTRVRSGVRGVRRGIIRTALKMNQVRIGSSRSSSSDDFGRGGCHHASAVIALDFEDANDTVTASTNTNGHSAARTNLNNGFSMLRGRLLKRQASCAAVAPAASVAVGAVSDGAVVAAGMGDMDAWSDMETIMQSVSVSVDGGAAVGVDAADKDKSDPICLPVGVRSLFYPKSTPIMDAALEFAETATSTVTAEALSSRGGSSVGAAVADESAFKRSISMSLSPSSLSTSMIEIETYVIETPLFPIILPKAFEPSTSAVAASTSSRATASVTSLEVSVGLEEAVSTTASTANVAEPKPSAQLLQAATMPLLPKTLMESFTGREFYYPESIEALAATGIQMTLGQGHNEWVNWSGEKKTDAFLRAHGTDGKATNTQEWYRALDTSQEVLVWVGKSVSRDGYGAELPIIKTTSIIHKSPKYLAELLMDSSKVKVYNKMSLGRTDERVFQTGVDTQGGSFGEGESKVVRNLTKPPMVNSIIEFVTCMHARKLRPSDVGMLHSNDGDTTPATADGYIVVSRAVTGGNWSAGSSISKRGEKLVRNEILMGVNVLRAIPGEPDKTELTSVTHVYSPMIPLILAKNAGVKGAVDFVRDIRALP